MSEKHDAYQQVRLQPDIADEIERLKAKSGYTAMSMAAFVDSLIRKGIEVEKEAQAILRKMRGGK